MRRLAVTMAATLLLSAGFAAAASLGIAPHSLGTGSDAVHSCDTDGFTLSYTVASGEVTDVTVSGIADPACEGAELALTLAGSGTKIGSGGPVRVSADGDTSANSVTLAISEQPSADVLDRVHVVVTGP